MATCDLPNSGLQQMLTIVICRPSDFFRDVTPVLAEPALLSSLIDIMASKISHLQVDRVLGIESRGFLFGPLIAQKLLLPFGVIRKKGKLPGSLYSVEYDLEYGKDTLEIQKDALPKQSKCVIVDDLVATGGSLEASKQLVELSGSQVEACLVIIELKGLNGCKKLNPTPLISLFEY